MLFHIKQSHAPAGLPVRQGRLQVALRRRVHGVTIHGYWLAFPQHTTYLIVETDDVGTCTQFLKPGAGVTTCEITPVSDQPVPPPA